MFKHVLNFTLILYVSMGLVVLGCGSTKMSPEQLPEWVSEPPRSEIDGEYLYVVESGTSRDEGRARRKAMQNARAALALKVEAAVAVLVKSFEEEVGGDPNSTEVLGLFAQVSKSVADQVLVGSGSLKTHLHRGEFSSTVYVLMELPQNIEAKAFEVISKNEALYNRWRAGGAFEELNKEREALKKLKKEETGALKTMQQQEDRTTP